MRIDIVTLFPAMVEPVVAQSILGRARARGLVDIQAVDLRDYAGGRHRVTDDAPFGGGGGMVLKPEPLFAAVEARRTPGARVVLADPRGRRFTQAVAAELALQTHLILLAGRYEGVDERVRERLADDAISIGDYVLTGGELPALVIADAVVRLVPDVLGGRAPPSGVVRERAPRAPAVHAAGRIPGGRVPPILLSGDHARIERWRRTQALWQTWKARPELLAEAALTADERRLVEGFERGEMPAQGKEDDADGRDSAH